MPLICDCRSHLDQDWEVRVKHIYYEANECVWTLWQSEELTNGTFCLFIVTILVL